MGIDNVIIATNDDYPYPLVFLGSYRSVDTNSTRWITTTAGQRGIHLIIERRYVILDFNSENLRQAEKKLESLPLGIILGKVPCMGWGVDGLGKDSWSSGTH